MRGPMRWAAGAAAAAMLAAGTWWILDVRASTPVDLTRLTEAQWHEDLHAMAQGVARRHVNAFHRVSREQYQELVGQIDVALHGAPGPDVPVLFERLTAAVGDAHTYVNITDDQHYYPFITYRFGDDWRVARALPEERDLLGARLVKIDDADMGRVEAGLHEILTQGENRWFYLFNEPWFLTGEVLHALRLVRDPAAVTFTFARDDGTTFTRTMGPHSGDPEMVRAYQHPPLYLEHKDADFWFTTLPGTRALYLVFNGYEQLRANAARLFEALDQGADALIVDLRGNAGGDYLEGHRYLIEPLLQRPRINQKGHLFVITGRRTFSAAMNNAVQFRTDTRATLVGEPPGEAPNSYQEKESFRLPNSHLLVNVSVRYYRFLADDVPALLPDQPIDPDWQSYREGRDPALDWIVSQLPGRDGR